MDKGSRIRKSGHKKIDSKIENVMEKSRSVETGVIVGGLVDEHCHHHHHHESLDVGNLENSFSSKLPLNNSNEVHLNEDCLLEIFSYLSLDDMIQVNRVCKKWYQASQQWFKQVLILVYNYNDNLKDYKLEVYEKYNNHKIYEETTETKNLMSFLRSCGHRIEYFKVISFIELEDLSDERKKFLFQWVPKYCENIVDLEIYKKFGISIPWNFEVMTRHWKKLEKINIQYVRKSPYHINFCKLLCNNEQLVTLGLDAAKQMKEIKDIIILNEQIDLYHFISASKNFISLQSLEISGFRDLTIATVEAIAEIKSLIHLNLLHGNLLCSSHKTLDSIKKMKDLKSLGLSNISCMAEKPFVNILNNCSQLEQLYLYEARWLREEGMIKIAKLERLKCLKIDAPYVSTRFISSCENLEVLWFYYTKINISDIIKLLNEATKLRFVGFFYCSNLTRDILQAAREIANESKNFLCIFAFGCGIDAPAIDTPYFKYFKNRMDIPLELFPKDMRKYIQGRFS